LNDSNPERRLRLGYVSFDFSNMTNVCFLEQVFSCHDRNAFELCLYNNTAEENVWSNRLRTHATLWRNLAELGDEAAAQVICEDGIDILVDLSGHLSKNRLRTFARKPAPVQATWLSYPATTGLDAIDYRITDPYCDPPGDSDRFYTEKLYRLPRTYWCYQPPFAYPVTTSPLSKNDYLTFGSFNLFAKINDDVIATWARILNEMLQTRLLILTVPPGDTTEELRRRFAQHGVDNERVMIEARLTPDQFHRAFSQVDIALDPFPCNGATTTLDTLWNGVPVVTLAGHSCVSRAGVSMLSNVGLQELIAGSTSEYVEIAVRLAKDPTYLEQLRRELRVRLQASPMMDTPRFTAELEAAYRNMWRAWCSSQEDPVT
jgi:predicted O-linked N-acetylglucosamine transferase (SPINDLY family)